jgi:hypothetical protein
MQNNINPNKDLPLLQDDDNYFGAVGQQYLSKSSAGALLGDVRQFLVKSEDNINFELGSYFHHLLIEPEKASIQHLVNTKTRNNKAYRDYIAEHQIPFAVLESEKVLIDNLAAAMLAIPLFEQIIYDIDNQYEVAGVKKINGFWWKGKADIVATDKVYDLKTTSDINRFRYSAKAYHYDLQAYLYREIFGKDMVFLVACKKTATCGIFECSDEFYNSGEHKAQRAVEQYHKYYGENATHDPNLYYIKSQL